MTKRKRRKQQVGRPRLILGVFVALACSGKAIDVGPGGTSQGGSPAAGGTGATSWSPSTPGDCTDQTPLPTWPDDSQCLAQSNLPLVGRWQGYVENQMTPWDQLVLDIKGASVAGGICGTLTLGSAPLPPAATDPNVGYPPDNNYQVYGPSSIGGSPNTSFASYRLTLLQANTDGRRVRFRVSKAEPFHSWCQLQTSYRIRSSAGNTCTCLPLWPQIISAQTNADGTCTIEHSRSERLTANCGMMALCLASACQCNASGCDAPFGVLNLRSVDFDLRFSGNSAVGSNT